MKRHLYGILGVLFAGVLWLGCNDNLMCEDTIARTGIPCESAGQCPVCEEVCIATTPVSGPRCEPGAVSEMECVCTCEFCYSTGEFQ